MKRALRRYVPRAALCALALLPAAAPAQVVHTEHTEAELVAELRHARPGAYSWLALRLKPAPGWHVYWRNPGDSGQPTRLRWTLPEGVSAGEIHWPYPERERLGDVINYGYSQETLHLVPISIPRDWPAGRPVELKALAKWLVCSDICIPGEAHLTLQLDVADAEPPANPKWAGAFAEARARLPQAADWPAQLTVDDETVRLTVKTPALADAERITWFPVANDLVTHSAPQQLEFDNDGLRLRQQRSAYFTQAPQIAEGVLVVKRRGATRAYTVSARTDGGGLTAAAGTTPGLALALAFALLGGLILNLMPCVFPVLSLKAVSLLEAQHETAARKRAHALAYTGGVLASFGTLALLLRALHAAGAAAGWGFQLQNPLFVAVMAYLLFAMALALSGVVQFGTRWMGLGQSLAHAGSLRGSFFTGVLAVVVASPCTAPFMGVAMGYALTQSPPVTLAVFAALGLGLALPFLLLGFVPLFARLLPRPGAWMETFKQLMAFPLYLTVVWLLWVLGELSGRDGVALVLVGCTLLGFALWLWHRPGRAALLAKLGALALALALLGQPALRLAPDKPPAPASAQFEAWSPQRVTELRRERRTIFVNFTADWCVSCLVNERVALRSEAVRKAFTAHHVAYLKGDWTRADPAITAALAEHGRSGVPLYLLYRDGGQPQVLPQLLTPDIVISSLRKTE